MPIILSLTRLNQEMQRSWTALNTQKDFMKINNIKQEKGAV